MVENEDNDNAKVFTKQLGDYLHYVTRNAADEVPLGQEVNHARNYAEIQARRYRKRIALKYRPLPEQFGQVLVPRLILQPLIENAFEHGLLNKTKDGLVYVDFQYDSQDDSQDLIISVEDNGEDLTEADIAALKTKLESDNGNGEITGMVNVHRRLQLKYGSKSGLDVSRADTGGLLVLIKICLAEGSRCTDC